MSALSFGSQIAEVLQAHAVLGRLGLLSLELLVLGLGVAGLIWLLRIRAPRMRALLWLIVLAKPILGMVIGTPLPIVELETAAASADARDAQRIALSKAQYALTQEMAGSGAGESSAGHGAAGQSEGTMQGGMATVLSEESKIQAAEAESARVDWSRVTITTLLGLWLAGVAFFSLRTLLDHGRIRRMVRASLPSPAPLAQVYAAVAAEMGMAQPPTLRLTDALESPALVGLWRPVILLPVWLAGKDSEGCKWLLRHELTHRKLHDAPALLVRRMAEVVFFFHPVVWWAGRKWEEAMELACDRRMLADEDDARAYAQALYSVLEAQQTQRRIALGQGLFATRTQIGKRIAALLTAPLAAPAKLGGGALSATIVFALLVLCGGMRLQAVAQAEGDAAEAEPRESVVDRESAIRERTRTVKADLRNLVVGLESYRVDHNSLPDNLNALTTPIAYLTSVFTDPFTGTDTKVSTDKLKMQFSEDYERLTIYSVGPDGIDQRGAVAYDPTNGTDSAGDIWRWVEVRDFYRIPDTGLSAKVALQASQLEQLGTMIESYWMKHKAFPAELTELPEYDKTREAMSADLFTSGGQIIYRVNVMKTEADFYSVGPDGTDDGGKAIRGVFKANELPTGDISKKLTEADLQKKLPGSTKPETQENSFLQQLLELQKQDGGRDNAMIHYVRAAELFPGVPNQNQDDLIEQVTKGGWSAEAEILTPYFELCAPALAEVRKGVALDYARNLGGGQGSSTPVPNYLAARTLARVLCAEGRRYESQGRYGDALENYLTALTYGRDYGVRGSMLIGKLIAINIERMAALQIIQLMDQNTVDSKQRAHAAQRLASVIASREAVVIPMTLELGSMAWPLSPEEVRRNPEEARKKLEGMTTGFAVDDYVNMIDRIEAEREQYIAFVQAHLAIPYWERDEAVFKAEQERMIAGFHGINQQAMPSTSEAGTRDLVTTAWLLKAQIATALASYRMERGGNPPTLESLVPTYLYANPIDPFSGKPFGYRPTDGGAGNRLWSTGPDKVNDGATLSYDPSNGTYSTGDVIAPR